MLHCSCSCTPIKYSDAYFHWWLVAFWMVSSLKPKYDFSTSSIFLKEKNGLWVLFFSVISKNGWQKLSAKLSLAVATTWTSHFLPWRPWRPRSWPSTWRTENPRIRIRGTERVEGESANNYIYNIKCHTFITLYTLNTVLYPEQTAS